VLLILDLMASEIISFLNQLRMEQVVRKVEKRLRKLRGQPAACEFRAVPGIEESLREVAYRYPVALVTGRNRTEALQFLAENQLDQLFAAVVTRNDVPLLKPHPLPLGVAARKIGVPVQRCVMVGDSNIDIRAAKAAGALSVGVLTGFGQEKDLRAADLVISSVAELPRWLQLQLPV
jgi:HAD superfamily hydrolase (TIGR01509 family)